MNLSDFNLIYNNKSAEAGALLFLCKFSLAFKSQAELRRTTEGFGGGNLGLCFSSILGDFHLLFS